MKTNELRIGNLIQDFKDLTVLEVTSINRVGFGVDKVVGVWGCEPIPLTEEWLDKLGFEESLVTGFKCKIMACPVIARFNSGILYLEVGGIYLSDRVKYV